MTSDKEIALCLSGGGYRATLFHLGSLRRLNQLGLLKRVRVITSVSGGSMLNGLLAARWSRLEANQSGVIENFDEEIAGPIRHFCSVDIRTPLLIGTRLNPKNWKKLVTDYFSVSASFVAERLQPLYQSQLLSAVPAPGPGTPTFVFCATNIRTGACWHFHAGPNGRMGDFYTGYCESNSVSIAEAIAASAAFPIGFSALRLHIPEGREMTRLDPWGELRPTSAKRQHEYQPVHGEAHLLTDGGVYDNLGIEPVWGKYALLVSDAGSPFASVKTNSQFIVPRLRRALDISMAQVGALRKRWLIDQFTTGRQSGALWAIDTILDDYKLPGAQGYPPSVRLLLQRIRTDLNSFSVGEIAALENHGYSLADAAIRSRASYLCPSPPPPFEWPAPAWSTEALASEALASSGRRSLLRDIGKYLTGRK